MAKHLRVIGTTEEALLRAESQLRRVLPQSFRVWLAANNGLGMEDVRIFPVLDDRDPSKTWDSIARQYAMWTSTLQNFDPRPAGWEALLPFAEYGTGDCYCFDFARIGADGEPAVVRWSHETGESDLRAGSFTEFVVKVAADEFEDD